MKKYSFLLAFVLLLGCNSQSTQIKNLETEVIAIHDEVMPKIIDINRVQRALKKIAQDTTIEKTTVNLIRDQVMDLNEADESMSTWMAEYKAPGKDDSFDSAMKHLNEEKVKIINVKNLINSSLKEGQELLKKLEQE